VKILSLNYEYPPIGGGGGVAAAALNERLVVGGDQVQVVTSAMRGLAAVETVKGVTVHRAACLRRHRHYTNSFELLTTLVSAYRTAARLIRTDRPDVIHTHFAVPSGLVALALSWRYGVPYVLTAHGSDIPGYNPDRFGFAHRLLKPAWRRGKPGAAALTSPSEYLAGLMRRNGVSRTIHVIPNGYTPMPATRGGKRPLVLVVARLFPRKGVQHFIEALQGIKSDWDFVVAGDGPYMDALKQQARAADSPVKFIGFVDHRTLAEYYRQARIFVFPSIRENFPMVLLEAMEAGCAVVTTDAEGCAEVVGDSGVVIPAGDVVQMRLVMQALMRDPARCAQLATSARLRVRGFRWERIATLYRTLLARVASEGSAETAGAAVLAPEPPARPTAVVTERRARARSGRAT
jgi:glycosyltransferase involved in cell wall biosynthesis